MVLLDRTHDREEIDMIAATIHGIGTTYEIELDVAAPGGPAYAVYVSSGSARNVVPGGFDVTFRQAMEIVTTEVERELAENA
jgi:hypothetical protein